MRLVGLCLAAVLAALPATAVPPSGHQISGSYLEARTCDVYTGACVANSEMGLTGKQALLAWVVDEGTWNGVSLDGLAVIAAVRAHGTLDDLRTDAGPIKAVLVVDADADAAQRDALVDMARTLGGDLVRDVVDVKSAAIDATVGVCADNGCASVKAEGLIEISTRCLGGKDHLCGNEEVYYPPLTEVDGATPAFTRVARYAGDGLGLTWQDAGSRSAFLATFTR